MATIILAKQPTLSAAGTYEFRKAIPTPNIAGLPHFVTDPAVQQVLHGARAIFQGGPEPALVTVGDCALIPEPVGGHVAGMNDLAWNAVTRVA
jgi:hypothetical protein